MIARVAAMRKLVALPVLVLVPVVAAGCACGDTACVVAAPAACPAPAPVCVGSVVVAAPVAGTVQAAVVPAQPSAPVVAAKPVHRVKSADSVRVAAAPAPADRPARKIKKARVTPAHTPLTDDDVAAYGKTEVLGLPEQPVPVPSPEPTFGKCSPEIVAQGLCLYGD